MKQPISNPRQFFIDLGGLHDATILFLSLDNLSSVLTLSLDDLNSNFLGLPDYKGERPVEIFFKTIKNLDLNTQVLNDHLRVYELDVSKKADSFLVKIKCSQGGYINFQCGQIHFREIE